LKTLPRLDGTVVTGDAGNCSAATASEIYTLGGDYVLQVKGNQPTVEAFCETSFKVLPRPDAITRKSHGRLCERKLMSASATPMATGIPFCRSVIRNECKTTEKGSVKETVLHYISNLDLRGVPPEELDELLSTHWKSCEIATHWIRDAQYREDFLLVRHPMALLNCTLLINAAAFITNTLRKRRKTSTPALREDFGRRPSLALRILMRPFDASVDF
jgi:predicted transposase YbfD/YdcC